MAVVRRQAGAAVAPHVLGYWGYADGDGRPVRQRELLSTNVVLIFGLGTRLGVHERGPVNWFHSFVGALGDTCPVIEHAGVMRGVQVDVPPLGARMILGVAMHELAGGCVELEDVVGADARRLDERLDDARTWDERIDLVEDFLARRLAAAAPPPPDVAWAWGRLRATRGRATVAELASSLGCSRKHLAARFRDHVGLPPKLVARTMRFRHATDLIVTTPLDELAYACGYYDQSHLDRDFRDFAGTTPTAFRADPRPVTFVQDAVAAVS